MSENGKKEFFRPSEYLRPTTVQEALGLLDRYGAQAQIVAGATDILVDKTPGVEALIDITGLGLDSIKEEKGGLGIGTCVTMSILENSAKLKSTCFRVLSDAAREMGTPQIRNVATIGGNLCSAVPSADLAPPLLVLDANMEVQNLRRSRKIPIDAFFVDSRKTALEAGEMLVEIQVPKQLEKSKTLFLKMERASVADLALVNVALRISLTDGNVCEDARIAFGAVAPTPMRARKAEKLLLKRRVDEALIKEVAITAAAETKPINDVRASAAYRREISRIFVERALRSFVGLGAP